MWSPKLTPTLNPHSEPFVPKYPCTPINPREAGLFSDTPRPKLEVMEQVSHVLRPDTHAEVVSDMVKDWAKTFKAELQAQTPELKRAFDKVTPEGNSKVKTEESSGSVVFQEPRIKVARPIKLEDITLMEPENTEVAKRSPVSSTPAKVEGGK